MGNLNAERDWGHAKDYVEAQWLILQQQQPDDFVIASGRKTSVRQFVEASFSRIGISIRWSGSGVEEEGIIDAIDTALWQQRVSDSLVTLKTGQVVVKIDPYYFRPNEVDMLWGDAAKAERVLGWTPKISLEQMVEEMVSHDLGLARDQAILKRYSNE